MGDLLVGVITCSDSCARGDREDTAGKAVIDACGDKGWEVVAYHVCADDMECIVASLNEVVDVDEADVVFTVGGTGLGPRDVAPEATLAVAGREVPGIAEAIRAGSLEITSRAMLSRAVAAQRHRSLIINLPGSEKAARESLGFVIGELEHAVEMMRGCGHD